MTAFRGNGVFLTIVLLAVLSVCIPGAVQPQQEQPSGQAYQPGAGLPVGKILAVRGNVQLFHRDLTAGYQAEAGLPLYAGDTISTRDGGRVLCLLVDGSRFFLIPSSILKILQCNYNPSDRSGVSFLSLQQGAARFQVRAAGEDTGPEFKVQTETAFVETREADFIVQLLPQATAVVALAGSRLEVTGLQIPEEGTLLSDFQRTVVRLDAQVPLVETVLPAQADALKTRFELYRPSPPQSP